MRKRDREKEKQHYLKNKVKILARHKAWRILNPEICRAYGREKARLYRMLVLVHYSGSDKPFCKQCGFNDIRALHLDHINNNGHIDRKTIGRASQFHNHLIKNNYPAGYQVLCANCNTIKEMDRRAV